MTAAYTLNPVPSTLIIHTDGGSRGNPGPAATGFVILTKNGEVVHEFGTYLGETTNNVAEYTAVIDALNWIISDELSLIKGETPNGQRELPSLSFKLDSKLVVEQLSGNWKIKEIHLQKLAQTVWDILKTNHISAKFTYIPRAQNAAADRQVNLTLDVAQK